MAHQIFAAAPHFRPYRWAGADFQVGLQAIRSDEWVLVDDDYVNIMREKRAHLAAAPRHFYRSLPSSLPAQRELRALVVDNLIARKQADFALAGRALRCSADGTCWDLEADAVDPLWQLSQFVQEDFMLLEPSAGQMLITAASNAYSSSGRLVASVGHDIRWAHQPVPDLTAAHGARIDRILSSVHEGTLCARYNWMLTPLATLFFPPDPHSASQAALSAVVEQLSREPSSAPSLLHVRVERQTLRRLPVSRAVAFGIHTYSDPLSSLLDDSEALQGLLRLLKGYSPARLQYNEMHTIQRAVISWLETRLTAVA